jgi:hypothetical protein
LWQSRLDVKAEFELPAATLGNPPHLPIVCSAGGVKNKPLTHCDSSFVCPRLWELGEATDNLPPPHLQACSCRQSTGWLSNRIVNGTDNVAWDWTPFCKVNRKECALHSEESPSRTLVFAIHYGYSPVFRFKVNPNPLQLNLLQLVLNSSTMRRPHLETSVIYPKMLTQKLSETSQVSVSGYLKRSLTGGYNFIYPSSLT